MWMFTLPETLAMKLPVTYDTEVLEIRTEDFKTSFTSDLLFKCARMIPSGKSVLQVWFVGEAGTQLVDE